MRFFKVRAKVDKELTDGLEERSKKSRSNEFNKRVEAYAKEIRAVDEAALEKPLERDFYINFSSIEMESAVLIMATERYWESSSETKVHFSEYLKTQKYGGRIEKMDEITGKVYRGLLADAAKNDFIDGFDDTMKRYGMNTVLGQRWNGFSFEEFLLDGETPDQKTSLRRASAMGTVPTLCEEIERIYATTREVWKPGNPVHYTIAADDGKDKDAYFMLLMKALYASGRISGKRYTQIDYEELCEDYNSEKLDEVYRLQASGVVAIRIGKDNPDEGETVTGAERHAADICRAAMKWKNLVLTVFLFQRDSERVQDNFFSEMDYISLIRIEESVVFDNDAKAFLRSLAKENKVDVCKGLYKTVGKGVGYSKRDLRDLFDQWYSGHLKNNEFPQYSASAIAMSKSGRGPKGSGIDELNGLIGLAETKALVSSILDFAKAQKMYAFDKAPARQSLHMIFTGNPGTAKTTVARLVARILKENEVLRVGDLIEVGRADIIGKYVGHTAPLV
ncbi:MAG: AAA family ATPase, partial [Clostridiales bacterium]|nr:AAA family ATPase [Clostridiales bacterium]